MTAGLVGRKKKLAKRRNYKIDNETLARLQAIALIEDRAETAQLERAIREMADRWELDNPAQAERYKSLVRHFLSAIETIETDD